MALRTADDDLLQRKRELRLRIGRSRRRIDARLRGTRDQVRQLASWRTYAVRYPGWAAVAAFGIGLAVSARAKPDRMARWLGLLLTRHALGGVQRQLFAELKRVWDRSG